MIALASWGCDSRILGTDGVAEDPVAVDGGSPSMCILDCFGRGTYCEDGWVMIDRSVAIIDADCSGAVCPEPSRALPCGCATDLDWGEFGLSLLSIQAWGDMTLLCQEGLPVRPGRRCDSTEDCRFTLPRIDDRTGEWVPQYYLECVEGSCVEVDPPEDVGEAACTFDDECSLGWRCDRGTRITGRGTCREGLER